MDNLKNNKHIAVKFLADALPNNDVEYVKSIITDQTVDLQPCTKQRAFPLQKMVTS